MFTCVQSDRSARCNLALLNGPRKISLEISWTKRTSSTNYKLLLMLLQELEQNKDKLSFLKNESTKIGDCCWTFCFSKFFHLKNQIETVSWDTTNCSLTSLGKYPKVTFMLKLFTQPFLSTNWSLEMHLTEKTATGERM